MAETSSGQPGWWRHYDRPALDPVLSAAVDAFNDIGYHGATVRDIARRCGLSVAGIYHHHAGKQEMLFSILQASMTDLLARSDGARADAGTDPRQRFCNSVETLALSHMYHQALTSLGSTEMRALTPENRTEIRRLRALLQQRIEEDVAGAVAAGAFGTPYPRDAARAVTAMCIATGQWYRADGELDPHEIARRCVQIALDSMHAHEPQRTR